MKPGCSIEDLEKTEKINKIHDRVCKKKTLRIPMHKATKYPNWNYRKT
jgi:hypothetical protein